MSQPNIYRTLGWRLWLRKWQLCSSFQPVPNSRLNLQDFRGVGEGSGGAAAAPPATGKRLYVPVTRKVSLKIGTFASFMGM